MEAHPLRGAVRFPLYPLMAICAGCLSGFILDLTLRTSNYEATFFSGVWGGAVALGLSLSIRWWIGPLIAPMLGALGMIWDKYASQNTAGWTRSTWEFVLSSIRSDLLRPWGPLVFSTLLTVPLLGLHQLRLRRPGAWPRGWLIYAAAAAPLWAAYVLHNGRPSGISLAIFLVLFNLGSRAAWEAALKLSGPQMGNPSSRVASS